VELVDSPLKWVTICVGIRPMGAANEVALAAGCAANRDGTGARESDGVYQL
jgi:hypothetical protein